MKKGAKGEKKTLPPEKLRTIQLNLTVGILCVISFVIFEVSNFTLLMLYKFSDLKAW